MAKSWGEVSPSPALRRVKSDVGLLNRRYRYAVRKILKEAVALSN